MRSIVVMRAGESHRAGVHYLETVKKEKARHWGGGGEGGRGGLLAPGKTTTRDRLKKHWPHAFFLCPPHTHTTRTVHLPAFCLSLYFTEKYLHVNNWILPLHLSSGPE